MYRALHFLLANGFIHKLESINAFVACHHPDSAQHSVPFLICNRCHSATELEDASIVATLDAAARGFSVVLLESHDFAGGTSSRATKLVHGCLLYTSPSPRDRTRSRMPSSALKKKKNTHHTLVIRSERT